MSRILTVGSNYQNWSKLKQWCDGVIVIGDGDTETVPLSTPDKPNIPELFYSVGFHPHDAVNYNQSSMAAEMVQHLASPRCVALGEIGLDYHYDHSPRTVQISVCEDQLQLAVETQKPVIIHSRDGEEDLLKLLRAFSKAKSISKTGTEAVQHSNQLGVIHCFSGSLDFAKSCLELGFFISFSGIVTFKKAEEVREVVRFTPLDRILLETDSPYLAPVPHRGKTNESALITHTASLVAELKSISTYELMAISTKNARTLFNV